MSDSKSQWPRQRQSQLAYNSLDIAAPTAPDKLVESVTTDAQELWKQNEQLCTWLLCNGGNWILRTVPGGGKSHYKENIVPLLAANTEQSFVLATTEYRNRQETYRNVLQTIVDNGSVDDLTVVYIPSPRESYENIPQLQQTNTGEWEVRTPEDTEAVCQTFTTDEDGELIHDVAEEINEFVNKGATTGAIHKAASNEWTEIFEHEPDFTDSPLVCHRHGVEEGYDPSDPSSEPACRHRRMMKRQMRMIENDEADIIICGASLLNQPEVVQDSTVITDEDVSGELVQTYPESHLEKAVENYLSGIEVGPNSYRSVGRGDCSNVDDAIAYIRENHAPQSELEEDDDREPLVNPQAPIESDTYHYDRADAPLLTLAWLEGEHTEQTNHLVFNSDTIPYTVACDLNSNNANNSHDMVTVAAPPQALKEANQVIALDATGSEDWWELTLGVDFKSVSPNPHTERGTVVSESFDIEFRTLTEHMVPINRPDNLSVREFYAIIQAVANEHDAEEVSIVTSKAMIDKVKKSEYADEVMELAYADEILYFGALRSDRTFERSRLHIVIGAPHPGDDAIRQRMALLGYDDKIIQNNYSIRGEARYKGKARDVLEDMIHSEVYQAARRAARDNDRDETAYVYLFTRMFDENLINADDMFSVDIFGHGEKREGGTEAILSVLDTSAKQIETTEVVDRVNDHLEDESLSENRVREKLNELSESEAIKKHDWIGRQKRWSLINTQTHGQLVAKEERDRQ